MGVTVAVTGPTGELGRSVVAALERDAAVDSVLGMARRPFDPASRGWHKTQYRRGDVLDRDAVDALVCEADVVVHLAFVVFGSHSESSAVNLAGARNVFEATVAQPRPRRLVFTSSVAAYGYHSDTPVPIAETVPARGSAEHYYSAQKAACEQMLAEVTAGSGLEVYVLRPCIVAGPQADQIVRRVPWRLAALWFDDRVTARLPAVGGLVSAVAGLGVVRPVLPDPGVTMQLVHHDDVADAVVAAALGTGPPGVYNVAGAGTVTTGDYVRAVGALPVPVPQALVGLSSRLLAASPWAPAWAEWLHTLRVPMLMDTSKAREQLGWVPRYTAAETLAATVARAAGSAGRSRGYDRPPTAIATGSWWTARWRANLPPGVGGDLLPAVARRVGECTRRSAGVHERRSDCDVVVVERGRTPSGSQLGGDVTSRPCRRVGGSSDRDVAPRRLRLP